MPNFVDNVGLGFLWDDEESRMGFVGYLTQNGRAITGYYGMPSLLYDKGSVDIFVKTRMNEEGNLEVAGIDTHCSGVDYWEMRNVGMDITPEGSLPTERVFMFKDHKDGTGFVPIHLINADVLPSFLEDDVVKMQTCAFPLCINYCADEDEYAEHQPRDKTGNRWLLEDGALFPAGFLGNHSPERDKEDIDCSADDQVLFRGTVKDLYCGTFEIGGDKANTHVLCVIDTKYGELQLAHTIDQVEEEQRDNIKVGAIVWGVCILSGDVAILEYEKGIVKNFENNFRLLRQVIAKGEAERLRSVLCEDAVYISDSAGETYEGANDIIERFNYVHNVRDGRWYATPATITDAVEEKMEYTAGTRCILISYDDEENYEAVVFVDVTECGDIEKIHITKVDGYKFKVDEKRCDKSILEDIKIPESAIELIYNRAKFHGMVDGKDEDELLKACFENSTWRNNAERMLDVLMNKPRPEIKKNIECLFGYLFAKAIEMTFNESKEQIRNFTLSASYNPDEAFGGEISTELFGEEHQKIVSAMELGRQFYRDFENFVVMLEPENAEFMDILNDSLIVIQGIGECYALKYLQ